MWRLCREKYATTPFDGYGAAQSGNRWNSKGVYIAYAAESAALAQLEMLAHIDRDIAPADYVYAVADIPDELITTVDPSHLPPNWRTIPPPPILQKIGDAWVTSMASVALRVPSVLSPTDANVLINPRHPDAGRIRYEPLTKVISDPRLFGKEPSVRAGGSA